MIGLNFLFRIKTYLFWFFHQFLNYFILSLFFLRIFHFFSFLCDLVFFWGIFLRIFFFSLVKITPILLTVTLFFYLLVSIFWTKVAPSLFNLLFAPLFRWVLFNIVFWCLNFVLLVVVCSLKIFEISKILGFMLDRFDDIRICLFCFFFLFDPLILKRDILCGSFKFCPIILHFLITFIGTLWFLIIFLIKACIPVVHHIVFILCFCVKFINYNSIVDTRAMILNT